MQQLKRALGEAGDADEELVANVRLVCDASASNTREKIRSRQQIGGERATTERERERKRKRTRKRDEDNEVRRFGMRDATEGQVRISVGLLEKRS